MCKKFKFNYLLMIAMIFFSVPVIYGMNYALRLPRGEKDFEQMLKTRMMRTARWRQITLIPRQGEYNEIIEPYMKQIIQKSNIIQYVKNNQGFYDYVAFKIFLNSIIDLNVERFYIKVEGLKSPSYYFIKSNLKDNINRMKAYAKDSQLSNLDSDNEVRQMEKILIQANNRYYEALPIYVKMVLL